MPVGNACLVAWWIFLTFCLFGLCIVLEGL